MKLKVCGMNHNPTEVAQLQPNYLGFIFWEPSSRFFEGEMPDLPKSIKKVGVFVDAPLEEVLEKVAEFQLDAVQLHGKESVQYCSDLKSNFLSFRAQSRNQKVDDKKEVSTVLDMTNTDIIKVFSIKDDFDFSILKDYETICDYFLFDTKGKLPGGNGYTFDWSILENYPSNKPFFLSGGIGLESIEKLKKFKNSPASKYCFAIDVNSKFETQPGLKNITSLKTFINELNDELQLKTDN
ncbi:phosphoribosylanthranilate isomerase [Flagellimonas zhangzhouensis]|uniref:N-(5'-phosphoribosyl)anthranilate isomerase n=1 Tax=Flagellimonas zhangzhouensis TaxID=1073328 RepID=A0A1H2YZ68_9FLAO|nr:phosphoribosylanthranilate isomerase [Allomuricauda zhangzhouensis]SDR04520.1 phosphoribosylanthranilate isomerase [Allomuricauda zhangzhouensis]SDX10470.1 phosphoribosylanthranilate isomerase [Allomuricauda zhangzhouensis]